MNVKLKEESMSATAPSLSVVAPAYNSQDCPDRALATLVGYNNGVEVLIANNGLKDSTARMANEWAPRYPGITRAIHQKNEGRDDTVDTGIKVTNGTHVCVCDSGDWVNHPVIDRLLDFLREGHAADRDLDLIVTNCVYEKQGKAHKMVVYHHNILSREKTITWEEVRPCHYDQYMMMHPLTMRTETLRRSDLTLPEYTFYVDYLYLYTPLPLVHMIRYLNIDLYQYFTRRDDQPVNEKVMISRLDQLLRVNREMVAVMPEPREVSANLYRYMVHYLCINYVVTTVTVQFSGTPEHLETKDWIWNELETIGPATGATVGSDLFTRLARSRSRRFVTAVCPLAQAVVGSN